MEEGSSAFLEERPAHRVVHPQVHDHSRAALVDNPDVDHLSVLAGPIEDPAAGRRSAVYLRAAPGALLVPGRQARYPDPTLARGRQVAWGNAEGGGGAGFAADGRGGLGRLWSRKRAASRCTDKCENGGEISG
jgi:hypothetical protein